MKKISLILLLTMFLVSCSNVPNVTVTPQVAVTSKSTLTPSPTLTPTSTPTATPDPLAGAPEGATDVKTVNGEKIYLKVDKTTGRVSQWMDKELTLVGGEKLTLEPQWFDIASKESKNGRFGRFYLLPAKGHGWPEITNNFLPMTVLIETKLKPPVNIFVNDMSGLPWQKLSLTFANDVMGNGFWTRYKKDIANKNPTTSSFQQEFNKNGGEFLIDNLGVFKVDQTHEYQVIIMDKDTIVDGKPISKSKIFQRFNAALGVQAYWAMALDADGNLIYVVAPINKLESLNDKQFRAMLLIPIATLTYGTDSSRIFGMAYSGLLGMIADMAGSKFFEPEFKDLPFLAIERTP
jgi:hypothetical protein